MRAGAQVRLIASPAQEMTVRAVIEGKAVCDFITAGGVQEWIGTIEEIEELTEQEMFPTKIHPTLAASEVTKWLDFRRVKPLKRRAYVGQIGTIIEAVAYGEIEITKDFKLAHNLNVPIVDIDNKPVYTKLEYAARINAQALNEALGQAGDDSEIANTIAYGSALSNLPVAIVRKLDTSDLSILAALSVFFA